MGKNPQTSLNSYLSPLQHVLPFTGATLLAGGDVWESFFCRGTFVLMCHRLFLCVHHAGPPERFSSPLPDFVWSRQQQHQQQVGKHSSSTCERWMILLGVRRSNFVVPLYRSQYDYTTSQPLVHNRRIDYVHNSIRSTFHILVQQHVYCCKSGGDLT